MTDEQLQALTAMNVPPEAHDAVGAGEIVAFDLPTFGGEPGIGAIQVSESALHCGIIEIYDPGGGLPTFLRFRMQAFQLARAFGFSEVVIFGASVINKELEALLSRHDFQPARMEIPANLGGGIMDVWQRTFSVPDLADTDHE